MLQPYEKMQEAKDKHSERVWRSKQVAQQVLPNVVTTMSGTMPQKRWKRQHSGNTTKLPWDYYENEPFTLSTVLYNLVTIVLFVASATNEPLCPHTLAASHLRALLLCPALSIRSFQARHSSLCFHRALLGVRRMEVAAARAALGSASCAGRQKWLCQAGMGVRQVRVTALRSARPSR